MKKLAYCGIVGAAGYLSASPAFATVVYSDIATFTGQGYAVGTSSGTPTARGGGEPRTLWMTSRRRALSAEAQ